MAQNQATLLSLPNRSAPAAVWVSFGSIAINRNLPALVKRSRSGRATSPSPPEVLLVLLRAAEHVAAIRLAGRFLKNDGIEYAADFSMVSTAAALRQVRRTHQTAASCPPHYCPARAAR